MEKYTPLGQGLVGAKCVITGHECLVVEICELLKNIHPWDGSSKSY